MTNEQQARLLDRALMSMAYNIATGDRGELAEHDEVLRGVPDEDARDCLQNWSEDVRGARETGFANPDGEDVITLALTSAPVAYVAAAMRTKHPR